MFDLHLHWTLYAGKMQQMDDFSLQLETLFANRLREQRRDLQDAPQLVFSDPFWLYMVIELVCIQ
jgi:hypothetical protein